MVRAVHIQHRQPIVRFENLACEEAPSSRFTVSGRGIRAEVAALGPDVFRLRIGRQGFSTLPSWAVLPTNWPPPKTDFSRKHQRAALQSECGRFTLDLVRGRWEVADSGGMVLFASGPGGACFLGEEAQVALSLQDNEGVFGLGESSGTFNKRGLIREFWNIDVGGHTRAVHANQRNMYISIPFGISMRHGRAAGLFWDHPGRQVWDIGQTEADVWTMRAAEGEIDLYFLLGPGCPEILERYTELTGRMPMPPRWALGYHQCRYSYESRQRVEKIGAEFRRRHIPCDAVYLDIHYMDGYRVFTFGKTFPRPADMIARLARKGFKVVTIVDPGVKDDPLFPVLRRGLKENAFVRTPDGKEDYRGEVWPGRVRFPDFMNPGCRAWWAGEQRRFQAAGIAGFWNDMNEPADFSTPGKDLPADCLHQTEQGPQRHGRIHNVYGSQMARASFEGAMEAAPGQRPFIITRAGYAGLQRHALVWTGDNDSSWEHLEDSIQMLLNLSLSGVAFCGADVGGFHHNATGELLARWTQLAALTPFFRNHSDLGTIPQEPWAFGPQVESICRHYIELRYQLLPYLYGLFVEAHRHGTPIIRPLFWHAQNDPLAVAAGDQFLLGADLLVAPILRQGSTARSVYLPRGVWFDFWTGDAHRGGQHILAEASLEKMPLYVRGGAVIPMSPVQAYVDAGPVPTITLHLWPATSGELNWYEDDGQSLDYQGGIFSERNISFAVTTHGTRLRFAASAGRFVSKVKTWRIVLRSAGRSVRPKMGRTLIPVNFDRELALCAFEIPNRPEAFEIEWR